MSGPMKDRTIDSRMCEHLAAGKMMRSYFIHSYTLALKAFLCSVAQLVSRTEQINSFLMYDMEEMENDRFTFWLTTFIYLSIYVRPYR